ncbi:MAG: endo,4-beta-xylanase [Actinomycetota bacterium]|nr:endo,4-beta-xylanase [Actinomycetota bacterium]
MVKRSLGIWGIAAALVGVFAIAPAVATVNEKTPSEQTLRSLALRHGLYLGTAVDLSAAKKTDEPRYSQIIASQFSTITAENVMKWDALEPERGKYTWAAADAFMSLAADNHQLVRGHVLVWHNQLPCWLTEGVATGTITRDELREILKKHITTVVKRYRGRIWQWDVVNEAVSDSRDDADGVIRYKQFWYQHLGEEYIADAFRWARAADPKALLFYNDYNIEAFGDGSAKDKTQFVHTMVKNLRVKGVPIDGIGSQGHLSTRYGNYDAFQIAETLDRFASLGVATAITEADVRSPITEGVKQGLSDDVNAMVHAQAANYSALLRGCLGSRKCLSFTLWGFDDKHHWTTITDLGRGRGAESMAGIYDAGYRPKQAFTAMKADLAFSGAPYVQNRLPQKPMP